jgi:hypothetical protein
MGGRKPESAGSVVDSVQTQDASTEAPALPEAPAAADQLVEKPATPAPAEAPKPQQ